jgi:hypothetical protein
MRTRLIIATGLLALCLSSASARAASASFPGVASAAVLVAVCDDGGTWVAVAVPVLSPTDIPGADMLTPLKGVGSVLSSYGCFQFALASPFDGSVVPDSGDGVLADAAVWSRTGPVDRSSVAP